MKLLAVTAIALMLAGPALACDEDSIDTVSDDGEIIQLLGGDIYRSLDPGTSGTWLSTEDVLVCGDKMVNKDNDGETISIVPE